MSRLPKIESSREAMGDGWAFYNADCYDVLKQIPDNSIGMSIYSPPFASLYVFSDSERDMSNCRDDEEFMAQYRLMLPELYRVTRPGRICVVHCQDMLSYANQQGRAGYRDFPGKLIAAHSDAGFQFHSRVTVWKNPEDEVSRTKTSSLLWSQMLRDSTVSRQARADYLLVFRKWAEEGQELEPVTHREEDFPLDQWIQWASPTWETNKGEDENTKFLMQSLPTWMRVQPTDVLNVKEAKDNRDERHMAPLQLDLSARAIQLWSNPGDIVLSPFGGIGSEGVSALKHGRRFVGTEIKDTYFAIGKRNLNAATKQLSLFTNNLAEKAQNQLELFA